jgi:hypothetical protein
MGTVIGSAAMVIRLKGKVSAVVNAVKKLLYSLAFDVFLLSHQKSSSNLTPHRRHSQYSKHIPSTSGMASRQNRTS